MVKLYTIKYNSTHLN